MSVHTKKNLNWTESVHNLVTIQPKKYLVLGQIKQKYLVEKTNVFNSSPTASLHAHISDVKKMARQSHVGCFK